MLFDRSSPPPFGKFLEKTLPGRYTLNLPLPVAAKSVGECTTWGTGIALDRLVKDCSRSLVESASAR